MVCVFTPPNVFCPAHLLAVYLPAKFEEGFPLPLPRDTYLNSLELQIRKVSEKWVWVGTSKNAWEGSFRVGEYQGESLTPTYIQDLIFIEKKCFDFWCINGNF